MWKKVATAVNENEKLSDNSCEQLLHCKSDWKKGGNGWQQEYKKNFPTTAASRYSTTL
jgi:hypothetical protein